MLINSMKEANEEMVHSLACGPHLCGDSKHPSRSNSGRAHLGSSNTLFYFSACHIQMDDIPVPTNPNSVMERI
jgi:hypothetical protein